MQAHAYIHTCARIHTIHSAVGAATCASANRLWHIWNTYKCGLAVFTKQKKNQETTECVALNPGGLYYMVLCVEHGVRGKSIITTVLWSSGHSGQMRTRTARSHRPLCVCVFMYVCVCGWVLVLPILCVCVLPNQNIQSQRHRELPQPTDSGSVAAVKLSRARARWVMFITRSKAAHAIALFAFTAEGSPSHPILPHANQYIWRIECRRIGRGKQLNAKVRWDVRVRFLSEPSALCLREWCVLYNVWFAPVVWAWPVVCMQLVAAAAAVFYVHVHECGNQLNSHPFNIRP